MRLLLCPFEIRLRPSAEIRAGHRLTARPDRRDHLRGSGIGEAARGLIIAGFGIRLADGNRIGPGGKFHVPLRHAPREVAGPRPVRPARGPVPVGRETEREQSRASGRTQSNRTRNRCACRRAAGVAE